MGGACYKTCYRDIDCCNTGRVIEIFYITGPGINVPSVYGLDGSDVAGWEELVSKPATDILTAVIQVE